MEEKGICGREELWNEKRFQGHVKVWRRGNRMKNEGKTDPIGGEGTDGLLVVN